MSSLRIALPDELRLKARELQKTHRYECGAEFSVDQILWCLRRGYSLPKTCWSCKHGIQ